jgi:hypothetical protein
MQEQINRLSAQHTDLEFKFGLSKEYGWVLRAAMNAHGIAPDLIPAWPAGIHE